MFVRARLASLEAKRHWVTLLRPANMPVPMAIMKAIPTTCTQRDFASRRAQRSLTASIQPPLPTQFGERCLAACRRAVADDMPTAHLDNPVGDARYLPVVGDYQHRTVGRGLRYQEFQYLRPGSEVELSRRLVGQQYGVPRGQGPCDGDALLLAAGKLVGEMVGSMAETNGFEHGIGRYAAALPRNVHPELDVLQGGESGNRLKL